MEVYDIIMVVVLVGAMLFGAIKGFAWQLASIASILVSYVVALKFREPFSESIHADPPWNRFLAMLILYIGTALLIWVAFRMVSGSIDRMKLKEFDRHVGAVFGLAKGALYCTLITLFAVTLAGETIRETVVRSKSGNYIAKVLDRSQSVIPPEIHEVVAPYLDRFDDRFNQTDDPAQRATEWIADRIPGSQNSTPWNANSAQRTTGGPVANQPSYDPRSWAPQQAQQPARNTFGR